MNIPIWLVQYLEISIDLYGLDITITDILTAVVMLKKVHSQSLHIT